MPDHRYPTNTIQPCLTRSALWLSQNVNDRFVHNIFPPALFDDCEQSKCCDFVQIPRSRLSLRDFCADEKLDLRVRVCKQELNQLERINFWKL